MAPPMAPRLKSACGGAPEVIAEDAGNSGKHKSSSTNSSLHPYNFWKTAVYGESASWNLSTACSQDIITISQMLAQETAAPPAYVTHIAASTPTPLAVYVPAPVSPYTSQGPPSVLISPPVHKVNWQEGPVMGLKAAEGITKIVVALEGQQPDQNKNAFTFGN